MSKIALSLASLMIFCLMAQSQNMNPIVETKQGKLQGTTDGGISTWRGVPYAKAPVGNLRFKAPQPPDAWSGIKDASKFGAIAPQYISPFADEKCHEDCLFLNVWSPNADNKKRPVMFWIHGGGFSAGSGSSSLYNGASLAKKGDVVVVTINYRLGPLSFLYFDSILPGNKDFENNLGIQDQIAALKWVQENIEKFGGDPHQVTVFGQSSGATSAITLMSITSTKGLFQKVIAESPSLSYWTPKEATYVTERFLSLLHVSKSNLSELFNISTDSLSKVAGRLLKDRSSMPGIGIFSPTIDGKLLAQSPVEAIESGKAKDIALLIGTNKNEANLFKFMSAAPISPDKQLVHQSFAKKAPSSEQQITSAYAKYPKEHAVLSLLTDAIFRIPVIRLADSQQKHAPLWMYRMDWASVPLKVKGLRSCHGLELFFVFNSFQEGTGKKVTTLANKKDVYRISEHMQNAWINFAKTGNPNGVNANEWKAYDPSTRATMVFDKHTKLQLDPDSKQRINWGSVKLF